MSAAEQIETARPMNWDALEASPQWHRLAAQQKSWLVVFLVTGDPAQATEYSYRCSSPANARCLSYEIRKNSAVVEALNFWNGKSEQDLLLEQARENLRRSEPGSTAASKFLAMCIQLTGLTAPAATPRDCGTFDHETPGPEAAPVHRFKPGDVAIIDGRARVVLAVNAAGRPTEVEDSDAS